MKRILFIMAITLTGFIGLANVNADTIGSPVASCGDFPKDGDSLITNCSSSGDDEDLYNVRFITWYKGDIENSSTTNPGVNVGSTGVYESGYKYYLELGFKANAGNSFMENANFHMIGLSDATIIDVVDEEYIVRFEYQVHHVVHFETYGGTPIEDIVVTDWCSFDMPDDPTKDGYTFVGWYEDPEFEYNYWGACVEESFTLYAKFISNASMVKNIDVTLAAPVIGTNVTVTSMTDPEWGAVYENQAPTPIVTTEPGVHYSVDYTFWVQGICTPEGMAQELYPCDTKFEGIVQEDTYYYADIGIVTDDGYTMDASDLNITVNGQAPDEVFTVWGNNFTRFIAKVKSVNSPTMISSNKTSVDLGETFPGLENAAYLALAKNVTITNTGITTVTVNITNPTTQGFGCLSCNEAELAPGESVQFSLIPHPSSIYSKVPGTYAGNYTITATNVEDPEEVFQVGIAAKIVLLDNDMTKAKVTGIVNKTYTGKKITQPNAVVKIGTKTLKLNTDYTISYDRYISPGKVTMTIKGIGNYEGTIKKVYYYINKAAQPLTLKKATKVTYASTLKKKAVKVKPITIVKKAGTVTYTKLSGSTKLTINKTTGYVTVKKGTKKGTYSIKVKVNATGNANYKAGYKTVIVYVKVK